ncbi:poly polymerase 2 adp-ribosyltransferase 2 [Diplodia corticola]|uniref:Poly [ADP-ribose] polymerase n=1 Tax=Diplodia corticola TaxID=236234 RepID=A0A1J9RM13_9PEZI|nr:poly polymerase 2 adp-ribosyltransferase 2 [Diplodia corticola]OJD28964.1 poly polymerase 2 adp-ribosyltransferase 2 [Diplodia corticola]
MPPKRGKKAAAPAAPAAPPLDGCCVVFSGTFPGHSQSALLDQAARLGAATAKSVTKDATHLVTTQADFDKLSSKVKEALNRDIFLVSLEWLLDSEQSNAKADETQYTFRNVTPSPNPASAPSASQGTAAQKAKDSKKRQASPDADATSADQHDSKKKKGLEKEVIPNFGEGQIAKSRDIVIPLDEECHLVGYGVHVDPDGVIWDASLNQTNSGNNNNKFYRLQVLGSASGNCVTWSRWGRVGERGQMKALGNGSLDDAKRQFQAKFKDKSGLHWEDRTAPPKPKKYVFIERSYQSDDEEEDEGVKTEKDGEGPDCTLALPIQKLMQLIFNTQFFAAAMTELNYDSKKLPLGKLSKATIMKGFQSLKDLSEMINGSVPASASDIEDASNLFYSLIPHDFRRNRPPVIRSEDVLKREIELLENLADMKDASNIMKDESANGEVLHTLDKQYRGLGMQEMTPLDRRSTEFQELAAYLTSTRGHTHGVNYTVDSIFRIERLGENDRFGKSQYAGPVRDRRLLWHGSRATNFGGILSQGLRIAPPEAPVSGYMFGKGIYLADMSSKSANYCCSYISGGTALLLLCEAELGNPLNELTNSDYNAGENAKSKGMWSTWGKGMTAPLGWKDADCVHPSLAGVKMPDVSIQPGKTNVPGAFLQYNEFICYDVAQIRLRYLFQVRM